MAFAITLGAFLHANETLSLRFGDLALGGDPRISSVGVASRGGLLVREAKSGKLQFVPMDSPILLRRLKYWCASQRHQPNSKMFDISYTEFSRALKRILRMMGLQGLGYTLHSFRHGGATEAFLQKVPFADIMQKGRWASEASCSRYLNAGKGLLLAIPLPSAALRRIQYYAAAWRAASFGERGLRAG